MLLESPQHKTWTQKKKKKKKSQMKLNELDWVELEKSKVIFNWFYSFYLILAAQEQKNQPCKNEISLST